MSVLKTTFSYYQKYSIQFLLLDKTEAGSGYVNSLSVELEVEGMLNVTRQIEGTVFGRNELRITNIDGFNVDLPCSENILLFNNYDQPGTLKKVPKII